MYVCLPAFGEVVGKRGEQCGYRRNARIYEREALNTLPPTGSMHLFSANAAKLPGLPVVGKFPCLSMNEYVIGAGQIWKIPRFKANDF